MKNSMLILICCILIISKSCKVNSITHKNEVPIINSNDIYKTNKFSLDNGKEARETLIFKNEDFVYYNYYGDLDCRNDDLRLMMKTKYKMRNNVIQFQYKANDFYNNEFTMNFTGVITTDSIVFNIQNLKHNNKWITSQTFYRCKL